MEQTQFTELAEQLNDKIQASELIEDKSVISVDLYLSDEAPKPSIKATESWYLELTKELNEDGLKQLSESVQDLNVF